MVESVVVAPKSTFALMWGGFPVAGAALGWGVKLLAGWVVTLPWAPWKGPAALIDSIPEPQVSIGALAVGALAGLVIAGIGHWESLKVAVSGQEVNLVLKGQTQRVAGDAIAKVFTDGKQLVLLGAHGEELAREPSDLKANVLRPAFERHGYLWLQEDPHRDEFRRWVPDTPGLPVGADALLKARARGKNEDQRELRGELARLGVVVRDEKKRQYWRLTNPGELTTPG